MPAQSQARLTAIVRAYNEQETVANTTLAQDAVEKLLAALDDDANAFER